MKFEGTIIITDPCYLDSDNINLSNTDWWEESNYGKDMSKFGFTSYIGESTIIGDSTWYVFDTNSEETLGSFSADAGMVCVCLLKDVRKFNPHFEHWAKEHPQCVTIIKNFKGDVEYKVINVDDEEDTYQVFNLVGTGNTNFEIE
jgi:hypothetical protein